MLEPSGPAFVLDVDTDPAAGVLRFRLTDGQGRHLGANQVSLAEHSPALWQGLLDTRAYVQTYAGSIRFTDRPATDSELLEQIGLFLGDKVLGREITAALAAGIHHRTLLVRQPEVADRLSAAFARVPWEIARPATGAGPLFKNNLVVRTEVAGAVASYAPPPRPDEPLRALLVFAESPGSRPLAMRLEREQLLALFYDAVMPQRRVAVDVLCHGVTRKALREKVRDASGYHVVHWSGHGHRNLLELVGENGKPDLLTGAELVDLFAEAGGFIPQIVFLSACLSGALVGVRTWADVEAALHEGAVRTRAVEPERVEQLVAVQPGYTGTALALLGAGVPQVVAMRYEVGDDYARDLAGLFYRRLLADDNPKAPASALSLARSELLTQEAPEHDAVDHATPLLFGGAMDPLPVPRGRSDALRFRRPQPQPLLHSSHELDLPAELVGRGEALSRLRGCLEEGRPAVALIQGLAGLGKTALVAEAIHLWHRRFDGVFAFQATPLPLGLDDFLRRLDERLAMYSKAYRELCEERPNAAVYLPPSKPLSGQARWHQMRDNLLEVLCSERLLLVLDNFETNLEQVVRDDGYACADPEWDRLLQHLAEELPGSGSRLLVSSRHRLAVLAPPRRALWLPLGPLPMAEAVLFLQGTESLRRLAFSDEAGRRLALQLLEVSRGHPLILTRLGALAGDRQALTHALEALKAKGLDRLPDVFAPHLSQAECQRELAYLEDVAVGAVDLLIQRATPEARRLLWLVTLALEPVTEELIQGVWSGRSAEEELFDQLRSMLAQIDQLPEGLQEQLRQLPLDARALLEDKGSEAPAVPLVGSPVADLTGAGLLAVEEGGAYEFHELVRERAAAWMTLHAEEKGGRTEEQVWVAYGERYAVAFQALWSQSGEGSRERAMEAGRRGISYLVRARAFEPLASFAQELVTSTGDLKLLRQVTAELEGIVEQVPVGKARWILRTCLADALRQAGRPDAALSFYEQAVAEAESAEDWSDLGGICQNWANALRALGQLDDAKITYLRSAEAKSKAGSPRADVLMSEFSALRVEVMRGGAERALPEVESRLQEVRLWWQRYRAGEAVPEAPNTVFLARVLIHGMGIAHLVNQALGRSEVCLVDLAELEETQRALGEGEHALAITRFNRYGPLLQLDRPTEAQRVLESCLEVFRRAGDLRMEAKTLSALANLWEHRGDRHQAAGLERQALAVRNRLPDLEDRSISHGNLALYLAGLGAAEEAARHHLGGISYDLMMDRQQGLRVELRNLATILHNAAVLGVCYELPRLSDLLAHPEFEPLQRTLAEWNAPLDELQAKIDQLVEEVRRWVAEGERPAAPA